MFLWISNWKKTTVGTYLVICDLVVKSRDLIDRKTSKQPRYWKEGNNKKAFCEWHAGRIQFFPHKHVKVAFCDLGHVEIERMQQRSTV